MVGPADGPPKPGSVGGNRPDGSGRRGPDRSPCERFGRCCQAYARLTRMGHRWRKIIPPFTRACSQYRPPARLLAQSGYSASHRNVSPLGHQSGGNSSKRPRERPDRMVDCKRSGSNRGRAVSLNPSVGISIVDGKHGDFRGEEATAGGTRRGFGGGGTSKECVMRASSQLSHSTWVNLPPTPPDCQEKSDIESEFIAQSSQRIARVTLAIPWLWAARDATPSPRGGMSNRVSGKARRPGRSRRDRAAMSRLKTYFRNTSTGTILERIGADRRPPARTSSASGAAVSPGPLGPPLAGMGGPC